MTTIPESEFHHFVGEWLREYFHPDCIEHEPRLETTDRIVDYRVTTPWNVYMVEVENRFEDLYNGVGQARFYAMHEPESTPVVILPAGDHPEPEMAYFEQMIQTEQVDVLEWTGGDDD